MKNSKSLILVIIVLCLSSCTHNEPDNLQEVASSSFTKKIPMKSESPASSISLGDVEGTDEIIPTKEDILAAFRFYINFYEWKYGNGNYSSYIDRERTVEIYYKKRKNQDIFEGYLFFPLEENGKTVYEEFSFLFGEEGFCSWALTDATMEDEPQKSISKKLTYLGTETFYFAKDDVCKPVFPESSPKKEKAISEFKQKITEELSSHGREKSKYKVYIQDFTNEDTIYGETEVLLVIDNKEIEFWQAGYMNTRDDRTEQLEVYFQNRHGTGVPLTFDWSDDLERASAEKMMELSVCDFSIVVP